MPEAHQQHEGRALHPREIPSESPEYEAEKAVGLRTETGALKLSKLKPIHYQAIALHLQGYKNREIAEVLNKTDATISRWFADPLFENVLDSHYREQENRLRTLTEKSVDAIEEGLNSKSENIKLKAAKMQMETQGFFAKGDNEKQQTAEDIIQRIMSMHLTVNVNQGGSVPIQHESKSDGNLIEHENSEDK